MILNITSENKIPLVEKDYLEQVVDRLNYLLDSQDVPFFKKIGEERISFGTFSNTNFHGKLIGIIHLFFAQNSDHGYVGIYPSTNYIYINRGLAIQEFLEFLKQFPQMSEMIINFNLKS